MHVMHCHTLVDYAYVVRILSLEYEYDPVSGKANWKLDFLFLFPFSVFGDTAPYGPGRSNLKTRPFLFFAPKKSIPSQHHQYESIRSHRTKERSDFSKCSRQQSPL